MKTAIKLYFLVSTFLLTISSTYAQSIPDSTMQKINGFRAFYETLGKAYPPDSSVSVTEAAIAEINGYEALSVYIIKSGKNLNGCHKGWFYQLRQRPRLVVVH